MYVGTLPPISNQQSWQFIIQVSDKETDDNIDMTGASIVFELRRQRTKSTSLSATTANSKITILEAGFFQVSFTRADIQCLSVEMYDVGCVMTLNGATQQLITATLPVLDGIVSQ